jgi:hypothetical protein
MHARRVDLRIGRCFPYLQVTDQKDEQACVAVSFAASVFCAKINRNVLYFEDGTKEVDWRRIFDLAIKNSWSPSRGTSFGSVSLAIKSVYSIDITKHGIEFVYLKNDVESVKAHLRRGNAVVCGYTVTPSIDDFHKKAHVTRSYGYMLPHAPRSEGHISGHCVLIVGYDDDLGAVIARNTWGASWGVDGHFLIRYVTITDVRLVTDLVAVV